MILRRYIGQCLKEYYNQPANLVVGRGTAGCVDHLIAGELHWKWKLSQLYKETQGQWLTPVELFQPYYSYAIGRWIRDILATRDSHGRLARRSDESFDIVELGGGRGTNAAHLLHFLREKGLVDRLDTYCLVDGSTTLHNFQKMQLSQHSQVQCLLQDLLQVTENDMEQQPLGLDSSDKPTFVIALEVLDNLPHDKIRRKGSELLEAHVETDSYSGTRREVFVPLVDPLLRHVVEQQPLYTPPQATWIPTVACGTLTWIQKLRPNAYIMLADFDYLPPPDLVSITAPRQSLAARGEPLVTDMNDKDHACYLSKGDLPCDILYPTDFGKLARFVPHAMRVVKQGAFLRHYAHPYLTQTTSLLGDYNPLLHDFGNMSIMLHAPSVDGGNEFRSDQTVA